MKLICVESKDHKYYLNRDNVVSVSSLGSMVEIMMVGGKIFRIPGLIDDVVKTLMQK